ncbi:MAG: winged helix-turn-helix domain-containing protein [Rhodobacteraceae bacterium]|nr:winged helix-turn-helix domain-containing protein [Paracoccaceae bacterium]
MPENEQVALGPFLLDLAKGTLSREGELITLRARSFALLCHLAQQPGRVATKDELLDAVWPGLTVTENSLTQAVRDIRLALGDEAGTLLRTIPRRGYLLDPPRIPADLPCLSALPRIAVLPFQDPAGPAERRPLLDALAEAIAGGLGKFRTLAVLARQSAFAAAAEARGDPMQAGRRLGADYVVEGTAWPTQAGLSVTLSLTTVADGRAIWNERYDLGTADILSLQDIVPRRIVQRLALSLETDGQMRAVHLPPERLTAFDHLARGLSFLRSYAIGANDAARDHFSRAIAVDPNFGLAYCFYAFADLAAHDYGLAPKAVKTAARAKAEHGLTLAPDEAAAWRIVAYFRAMTGDFAAAEVAALRAIALNPCYAEALFEMAFVSLIRGRHRDCLDWLARAEEIDPLFPSHYEIIRSEALYYLGQYDDAVNSLLTLPRLSLRQHSRLAACYAQLGAREAALDTLARAEKLAPGWDHIERVSAGFVCENPADLAHLVDGIRKALAFRGPA